MTQFDLSALPELVDRLDSPVGPDAPAYCTSMLNGVRCEGGPPGHHTHCGGEYLWTDGYGGITIDEIPCAVEDDGLDMDLSWGPVDRLGDLSIPQLDRDVATEARHRVRDSFDFPRRSRSVDFAAWLATFTCDDDSLLGEIVGTFGATEHEKPHFHAAVDIPNPGA